jgi:hypothetical protein
MIILKPHLFVTHASIRHHPGPFHRRDADRERRRKAAPLNGYTVCCLFSEACQETLSAEDGTIKVGAVHADISTTKINALELALPKPKTSPDLAQLIHADLR